VSDGILCSNDSDVVGIIIITNNNKAEWKYARVLEFFILLSKRFGLYANQLALFAVDDITQYVKQYNVFIDNCTKS